MDSKFQDLFRDTKNTKIGVRTKKLCKFQALKKISKHCSTFSRRGYCILMFSDIIRSHIKSIHILMDSTLQYLSNGTKNTQIGVRMTKLWSYEVGAKIGKLQQRRDVRTSRRSFQHRDVAESCRNVASRRHDITTLGVDFG